MVSVVEKFLGYSPSKRKVIVIGWFNFLVCFIPSTVLLLYVATGANGLDRFLYGVTDENPAKIDFLKTMSGFMNQDEVLQMLRNCQIKKEQSSFMDDVGDSLLEPDNRDEFLANYETSLWERWDRIRPKVILTDLVGPGITRIIHRTLFNVEAGSTFFLTIIFTILTIGMIFSFWLLVAVYSDSAPLMAAWIAEQILILFFDLSLLVCMVIYSGNHFLPVIQFLRICFGLYCIIIVHKHHLSLSKDPELGYINRIQSIHRLDAEKSIDGFKPKF